MDLAERSCPKPQNQTHPSEPMSCAHYLNNVIWRPAPSPHPSLKFEAGLVHDDFVQRPWCHHHGCSLNFFQILGQKWKQQQRL